MAALIARISRQNRERKLRLREELPTSKSNYVLVPFEKNFVPSRDNNVSFKKITYLCTFHLKYTYLLHYIPIHFLQYLLRHKSISHKNKFKARVEAIVSEETAKLTSVSITAMGKFWDCMVIAFSLSLVPIIATFVMVSWPV